MTDCLENIPEQLLERLRNRWNVENKNHHPRDATFLEDKTRCRKGNTVANLALLRGIALKLWRTTHKDTPAPAFIAKVQKNLDDFIGLFARNQRLAKLE